MTDAGPSRPLIKLPQPDKFSGEGDDLKPDKLKRWLRQVKQYLSKHGVTDATEDVVDYYGSFTQERAHNAYITLLDEHEDDIPTLEQFKTRFRQLFEASTNTDDIYQRWQKVQQTTGGKPGRISKVAGDLADLKGALPQGSVSDYAQKQRFLEAMDSKLRRNVEPQIRETDTWDQIVQLAERYDATMYKTGAYKGSGGNQNQTTRTQKPKKEYNNNPKPTNSKGKGKAPAKKKTSQKNKKPSKAEMDRRKAEGDCFYCGEAGHIANDCPKKEVKTNRVRISEDTDSEANYEEDSDNTEELDGENSIITFKTTVGQPKGMDKPFQALEFTILVNGKKARALADTGTIGGTLLSNRFVTSNNIPYKPRKTPVNLKMAVKGSRSTSNYSSTVDIQIGKMIVPKVEMMITPVSDYDILLSMDDLTRMGAIINCQSNSIYFPSHKVRVNCNGKSARARSAMAKAQEVPDFPALYPEVFVKEIPEAMPPVRKILHRIVLKDPTKLLKTPTFKAPQALMPKFKEWIDRQQRAKILHRTRTPGGASMFFEAKPDGRIRPLVDLRHRNSNTVADHSQIPNQQTILHAVARGKFRSKIDLSDAYFQTRVHPDDVQYNTIKTPFGGFASEVMMQGDMNAPATFVRVMEDLFNDELGKFVWVYIDDIFIFSNTFEEHIAHIKQVCNKLRLQEFYANPRKSIFFAPKLEILGHMIDDEGIHPAPEKIRTIMDWRRPNSQKELQRFNGMVDYISQFLPHAATITAPLTELTGDAEWLWTDLQETAFQAVKRAAEEHRILKPIDYNNPDMVWLFTDASPTGTGAWIGQGPTRDTARPAAFHSRKLTPAQNNYPTHQQEALAIVEAMDSFAHLLLHRHFTVVTDHESLTKLMTQKNLSQRQQRWLTYISRYDFKIEYQPGSRNYLADYLSRIHEGESNPLDITLKDPTTNEEKPLINSGPLSIATNYASPYEYSPAPDSNMSAQHSPSLTSRDSIYRTSPDYMMKDIQSNAVTRSQKRKTPPQSTPSISSNDSGISIDNTWGDTDTQSIPSEIKRRHSALSWRECTDDDCKAHKNAKEGANYWPRNPKKRKPSVRSTGKEAESFGPTLINEDPGSATLPDIPYLSE